MERRLLSFPCRNENVIMICTKPWHRRIPASERALQSNSYRRDCIPFPCGQCFNCRINRSREWALRILLEMMDHVACSFVTLTYNNFFYPPYGELYPKDMQLFFKRLRQQFYDKKNKEYTRKIRYFYCGEYGERYKRPHYHLALFNIGIEEKEKIEKAWSFPFKDGNTTIHYPLGWVHIGDLNKYSARYVSGYIMKGANKDARNCKNEKFKKRVEDHLQGRLPEYQRMSRRPGLGKKRIENIAKKVGKKTGRFREIIWQNKRQPVGSYLQSVIDEYLNITKEDKEKDFNDYSWEFMNEYFKENEIYLNKLIEENEQKEKNKKVRLHLRMRRNKI